jgi:peptidoglycan DL-endopeptidase CwlS
VKSIKEMLYDYAIKHLGIPYRWGGNDPLAGLDCSGFVLELLKAFGIVEGAFDTNAQGIYDQFKANLVPDPFFGCLVFFGQNSQVITHVGFALSDKLMIEAGGGNNTVTTLAAAIQQRAWIRIRPIARRKDLVAVIEPKWEG